MNCKLCGKRGMLNDRFDDYPCHEVCKLKLEKLMLEDRVKLLENNLKSMLYKRGPYL
jgi:hypothetical protein